MKTTDGRMARIMAGALKGTIRECEIRGSGLFGGESVEGVGFRFERESTLPGNGSSQTTSLPFPNSPIKITYRNSTLPNAVCGCSWRKIAKTRPTRFLSCEPRVTRDGFVVSEGSANSRNAPRPNLHQQNEMRARANPPSFLRAGGGAPAQLCSNQNPAG